jgi:hypothetical protein
MVIDQLYKDYFQKSRMFLYPLLDIKRGSVAVPFETFLCIKGKHGPEDMKFCCIYEKRNDAAYKQFRHTFLLNHNRLADIQDLGNYELFVFDFSDLKQDWLYFIAGQYNKMDSKIKRKILNYFNPNSSNYVYMESFLFSKKYFSLYASLLLVDINLLEEVGELCSKPDMEKETLILEVYTNKKIIN